MIYFKTTKKRISITAKLQNSELQLSHREKRRTDLKENDFILKQQNSESTKQRINKTANCNFHIEENSERT